LQARAIPEGAGNATEGTAELEQHESRSGSIRAGSMSRPVDCFNRAEPVSTSRENALERLHAQIIEHAAAV
jgi:hypothetical protein